MAIVSRERRLALKHKLGSFLFSVFRTVLILGIAYIILYPVLSKLSSSFMSRRDLIDQTVKYIPKRPTLDNYRFAMEVMNFSKTFTNSLLLSVVVATLQLVSSTFVGYGLARFRFKGRNLVLAAPFLH